jgi:arylsulfatase A-like enzyme
VSEPFKGTINIDIRDSTPNWAPFGPPKAPDGAPNVVFIVLDDVGFSALSSYGGPIDTPNIDRIAADGIRYTLWHTTALCSPTRSWLLTGRSHTRNSMACITEAAVGFPNASGTIPPENGMLPEILGELGWNTYMLAKWHLGPTIEMNVDATELAERPRIRALPWVPGSGNESVVSRPGLHRGVGAEDRRDRRSANRRKRHPVGGLREGW